MLKYLGRFVSGSGALLATLFFFLPWVLVSCNGEPMGTLSGWNLAAGAALGNERVGGSPLLFAFLVVAILALVLTLVLRHPLAFTITEIALGAGAIVFLLIVYLHMRQDALRESMGLIRITPKAGLIGTLFGYFLVAAGGTLEGGIYAFMRASPRKFSESPASPSGKRPWQEKGQQMLDELRGLMAAPPSPLDESPARQAHYPPAIDAAAAPAFPQMEQTDDGYTAADGLSPEAPPTARLLVQNGEWRSRRLLVEGDNVLLGRSSQCQICLPDKFVSRRHARLRYAQGQWFIQDQGSPGGTFVNGQRVHATRLHDGDIIRIGKTELRFQTT